MNETPQYTHDCDKCQFLGIYRNGDDIGDLYYCEQGGKTPTVSCRFSNNPADYISGMGFVSHIHALTEAHRRWLLREVDRLTKLLPKQDQFQPVGANDPHWPYEINR